MQLSRAGARVDADEAPWEKLLHLQATAGNAAVSWLLREPAGRRLVQRSVSGISTKDQLKANAQAWNTFLLLSAQEQGNFQRDVEDPNVDVSLVNHYIPLARASGDPVLRAWYGANIGAVAATAPGMMGTGLQGVADYGYNTLLRFRWFQVLGPVGPRGTGNRVGIAVLGLNLHRGPVYSGLGHGWRKIGDDLSFEFAPNVIAGSQAAVVQALEQHAAASPDNAVRVRVNNANCDYGSHR